MLGLKSRTDPAWVEVALSDELSLMRDHAHLERKAAEARYRSVTEAAIDAIVSADQRGLVVGWNRAAEEIFGVAAESARGNISTSSMAPW